MEKVKVWLQERWEPVRSSFQHKTILFFVWLIPTGISVYQFITGKEIKPDATLVEHIMAWYWWAFISLVLLYFLMIEEAVKLKKTQNSSNNPEMRELAQSNYSLSRAIREKAWREEKQREYEAEWTPLKIAISYIEIASKKALEISSRNSIQCLKVFTDFSNEFENGLTCILKKPKIVIILSSLNSIYSSHAPEIVYNNESAHKALFKDISEYLEKIKKKKINTGDTLEKVSVNDVNVFVFKDV